MYGKTYLNSLQAREKSPSPDMVLLHPSDVEVYKQAVGEKKNIDGDDRKLLCQGSGLSAFYPVGVYTTFDVVS